jgi:hypothetical protein
MWKVQPLRCVVGLTRLLAFVLLLSPGINCQYAPGQYGN